MVDRLTPSSLPTPPLRDAVTPREAYLNGAWVDESRLAISIGDPGFAQGVTITERLRTFGGRVWRTAEHLERLRRSAAIVGIAEAVVDEIGAAIAQYADRLAAMRDPADDWGVVAFATPGVGGEPTRCVHGMPLPFGRWAHQYAEGVRLRTSDVRQTPASCWPPELKCRSRMHYYLADRQAEQCDPGARALLLDQQGYVGEASTANVVMYNDGEGIVSPPLTKVLPGVSVAVLRELAAARGVPFVERDLSLEEFRAADEAWLASTSLCLLPIVRCDDRPIGSGEPGPRFAQMLGAWNEAVGLDIAAQAVAFANR